MHLFYTPRDMMIQKEESFFTYMFLVDDDKRIAKNANHCQSFVELASHALFCEETLTSLFVN